MHVFSHLLLLIAVVGASIGGIAQEPTPPSNDSTSSAGSIQLSTRTPGLDVKTVFTVKYVAADAIYLSGGKNTGLTPGMKLTVKRPRDTSAAKESSAANTDAEGNLIVAEVEVEMVASSSTVCEVNTSSTQIQPGDLAYISVSDAEMMVQKRETSSARKYPQVITFSEGDPLDEEVREAVPRPPLPEVNRMRGRIGIDYSGISSSGSTTSSYNQVGAVARWISVGSAALTGISMAIGAGG